MAKLKLISALVNSLNLKSFETALHLHNFIQAHNSAYQITPKIEATFNAIKLIRKHATRVHKHDYHLSPAPRNQITNNSYNFNNLKYAYPALQIPPNTSLAKRIATQCKQFFQNRNEKYITRRETHFNKSNFPPVRRRSKNIS